MKYINIKNRDLNFALISILVLGIFVGASFSVIQAESIGETLGLEEKEEILWLARIIYSETKDPNEQVLIAWVVRNRVEAEYKGKTYKQVASRNSQFSGLNAFDEQYKHNITRVYKSSGETWQTALSIAEAVYFAPTWLRPFSPDVKHFYSPRSVTIEPDWAADHKPVLLVKDTEKETVRFAFYGSIR